MEKLGSDFLEDFEKTDVGIRGKLLIGTLVSAVILTVVIWWLNFPNILLYIYYVVVGIPGVFFGVEAEKKLELKHVLYFFFLEKRRVYKTNIK